LFAPFCPADTLIQTRVIYSSRLVTVAAEVVCQGMNGREPKQVGDIQRLAGHLADQPVRLNRQY
jgi:hypothetical protein